MQVYNEKFYLYLIYAQEYIRNTWRRLLMAEFTDSLSEEPEFIPNTDHLESALWHSSVLSEFRDSM
jgi:hypothetical protein